MLKGFCSSSWYRTLSKSLLVFPAWSLPSNFNSFVIPSNILHDLQWLHELLESDTCTISYFIHYGTLGKGVGKYLQVIILKKESYCEASEKFLKIVLLATFCLISIVISAYYLYSCYKQEMTLIETTAEAECADIEILPY
jgi:hypothetical protein